MIQFLVGIAGIVLVVAIASLLVQAIRSALVTRQWNGLAILAFVFAIAPTAFRGYIPLLTTAILDGVELSITQTNNRLPVVLNGITNGVFSEAFLQAVPTPVVVSEPEPTIEPTPIIVYVTIEPVEETPAISPTVEPTQTPIPTPTVFVCNAGGDNSQFAAGCLPPTPVIFGK